RSPVNAAPAGDSGWLSGWIARCARRQSDCLSSIRKIGMIYTRVPTVCLCLARGSIIQITNAHLRRRETAMIYLHLPIWWTLWWAAAGALALALIGANLWRRRTLAHTGNSPEVALPTLREDLLWATLVLVGGAVGLGATLWLVSGYHTARALFVAAFVALV